MWILIAYCIAVQGDSDPPQIWFGLCPFSGNQVTISFSNDVGTPSWVSKYICVWCYKYSTIVKNCNHNSEISWPETNRWNSSHMKPTKGEGDMYILCKWEYIEFSPVH